LPPSAKGDRRRTRLKSAGPPFPGRAAAFFPFAAYALGTARATLVQPLCGCPSPCTRFRARRSRTDSRLTQAVPALDGRGSVLFPLRKGTAEVVRRGERPP